MTVNQAIRTVDELKSNGYSVEMKVAWLNTLDGTIHRDIVAAHEGPEGEKPFVPYDPDGDLDAQELIAPHPYDVVYRFWLESQIDLANAEMMKYNQSAALYNQAYSEFAAWYNRTHMPVRRVKAIRL